MNGCRGNDGTRASVSWILYMSSLTGPWHKDQWEGLCLVKWTFQAGYRGFETLIMVLGGILVDALLRNKLPCYAGIKDEWVPGA